MSIALIGAAIGLVAGIIQFFVLQRLVQSIKSKTGVVSSTPPQARVLNAVSWVDLAMFPAIGWFVGALLQDGGFAP